MSRHAGVPTLNHYLHDFRDPGEPIAPNDADFERRMKAITGSQALLEAQVRYHQYPCKIRGETDVVEALKG
jgi:hypothetical protein